MQNTYKIILDSYAKRLITTNSRSRTLYFNKNNKYMVDMARFVKKMPSDDLAAFFDEDNDKKNLKFSYGGISTTKAFEMFDKYLNNEITKNDVLDEYKDFDNSDFKMLEKEKKSAYLELYNKHERLKKQEFYDLFKINNVNNSIIKECGKDDLYIGYPYIQGRYNKDKVVRAPLVLHKVKIEENGENLEIINEGIKIVNPVFIMTYLVENDISYKDSLDFEILESDYMPIVKKIFENVGIEYKDRIIETDIERMPYLTKEQFKKEYTYTDNKFDMINRMVIGIFPISDKKIYDDVKDLKDEEGINNMLNTFYDKTSEVVLFDEESIDIDESKLKYITVLDYSQKKTLQNALTKNCVIQGPPGTGKSQVIANIAANSLLNGKNTLFCSEKRTATDVIYNRLGKLNAFALLLHDHISEKNYFYDSIVKAISTAKENIAKYKQKSFSFNQDYKIKSFFDSAKRYSSIVNADYKGITFRDVLLLNNKTLEHEEIYNNIYSLIGNKDELETAIYKYEASNEYQVSLKWVNELNKEFYSKYDISFARIEELLQLDENLKEDNNFVKNGLVEKFLNGTNSKSGFFSKLFGKNEDLSNECKDFVDNTKHNFEVFKEKPYSDNLSKEIFNLKYLFGKTRNQILDEFVICASKKAYKTLDFTFINDYVLNYDKNMAEAFSGMDSKREESVDFIARICSADIKEKLSNPKYNDEIQKLLGEINKKRKPPVKVIIDKYFDILKIIFPIWIMTPEVVSAVVPLKASIFDKVIFDEASQLFIEKAIPSISRSNSLVICGDSKQLRPTLFFESRYDDSDEDFDEELEQESALTETSLLDYATTSNKYTSSMLQYHYRCYYKELINFSNYAFYNGELVFASNIKGKENMPVETINVNGEWDGEKNIIEAKRVVELVKDLLFNRKENQTIGIVTLNVNQRDLILDLFDEECKNDEKFSVLYRQERERRDEETGEDESLFVKNLESVQGDERDIIIFSISYSKNEKGKIGSSLGEIQRQYGENRLNVAISRAKKKIYIIKSFMGIDLSVNDMNKGPSYFKKYLCYADALNSGNLEECSSLLKSLISSEETTNGEYEDEWLEGQIFDELSARVDANLYDVRRNIGIGSFNINIGVYNKESGKLILGIECLGDKVLDDECKVSDDIYRQYYLTVRGWNLHKVWLTEWIKDKNAIIDNILIKLNV